MSYYDGYCEEPYYEPTPADEIFFEAKQKLEECLKESVKYKLTSTIEENKRLKEENEKMKEKVRNIEWKEKSLNQREKDMERNVLRKKFSEMLKPLEERYQVYRLNYSYVKGDKCNKCNEDRKLKYKTPSGKTAYEDCSCSKTYKVWNTESTEIIRLDLYKDRNYPYSLSVTPKYDGASYDEMYCKFELKTFVESLDDTDMNFDMKEFDYKEVAFKNEDDCQRFCDYLNQKEKLPKKILQPKGVN
jgi:regulator of replication initiation timing